MANSAFLRRFDESLITPAVFVEFRYPLGEHLRHPTDDRGRGGVNAAWNYTRQTRPIVHYYLSSRMRISE
jgi:hypothetical protein